MRPSPGGELGLHVVVHIHNMSMCNSNESIGINIEHTTFIQIGQGPSIEKYLVPLWPSPPTITLKILNTPHLTLTTISYTKIGST